MSFLDEDINPDLIHGLKELDRTLEWYERADAYARGMGPKVTDDEEMMRLLGIDDDDDFRYNYAKIPIRVISNRLIISSIVGPDQARIDELIEHNELELEWEGIRWDFAKFGETYFTVWPSVDVETMVDIVSCSPVNTRVIYDGRRKAYAIKRWTESDGSSRATLYYANRIEKWIRVKREVVYSQDGAYTGWEPYYEDDAMWPIPNPYGEVPVFHIRNGRPYGTPEHYDGYAMQDGIVRTVIMHMASIDFFGMPLLYALYESNTGGGTSELMGRNSFDETADPTQETDGLNVKPGTILALRAKELGSLTPPDVSNFIETKTSLVDDMAQATGIPARYFFSPGGQHPAADSIREAEVPLNDRVESRQKSFTAGLVDVLSFALLLAPGKVPIDVEYKRPRIDDKSVWEIVKLKLDAGVSLEQALTDTGLYDAPTIAKMVAERKAAQLEMQQQMKPPTAPDGADKDDDVSATDD